MTMTTVKRKSLAKSNSSNERMDRRSRKRLIMFKNDVFPSPDRNGDKTNNESCLLSPIESETTPSLFPGASTARYYPQESEFCIVSPTVSFNSRLAPHNDGHNSHRHDKNSNDRDIDHRMTNNNRIPKSLKSNNRKLCRSWSFISPLTSLALLLFLNLVLCNLLVLEVTGYPDADPASPTVRFSKPYSQSITNNNPTKSPKSVFHSSTVASRATTSFLPSDAIGTVNNKRSRSSSLHKSSSASSQAPSSTYSSTAPPTLSPSQILKSKLRKLTNTISSTITNGSNRRNGNNLKNNSTSYTNYQNHENSYFNVSSSLNYGSNYSPSRQHQHHQNNNENSNNNANLLKGTSSIAGITTAAAERRFAFGSSSSSSSTSSRHRDRDRRRKNKDAFSSSYSSAGTTTPSSIDRPFYTKITLSDAVSKPPGYYGNYKRDQGRWPTKKAKSSHSKKGMGMMKSNSSKYYSSSSASSSSSEKYSRTKSKSSKSKSKSKSGRQNRQKTKSKGHQQNKHCDDYGCNDYYHMAEDDGNNNEQYPDFLPMPHTTEKSYHPPKLSLEPFFNFLTSLATASREVIMSKEQQHNGVTPSGTAGDGDDGDADNDEGAEMETELERPNINIEGVGDINSKYVSEEDDQNSEIVLDNSEPGSMPSKSRRKNKKSKSSKKGRRTKQKVKNESEEESKEAEPGYDPEGPIPIPLPNKFVSSPEADNDPHGNDDPEEGPENTVAHPDGLHILDVLRTPMVADYDTVPSSPPQLRTTTSTTPPPPPTPAAPPRIEPFRSSNAMSFVPSPQYPYPNPIINNNNNDKENKQREDELILGKPPSGRGNNNVMSKSKGQGYGTEQESNNKLRSETDFVFDQQQQSATMDTLDLQAQASSTSHAVRIVPPPTSWSVSGGLQQEQQQQQPTKDLSMAGSAPAGSIQQPTTQQEGKVTGTGEASSGSNNNDVVSKYPTTFVYHQPLAAANMPPGSNLYISPSGAPPPPGPPGLFGGLRSPHPFRMGRLRPNLHSYYDSNYHHYVGAGENQQVGMAPSEMIGIRHPFGPPHFTPPPHHRILASPSPSPPLPPPFRFGVGSGYGNRPGGGFMNMLMRPHRGTHYNGHTLASPSSSVESTNGNANDSPSSDLNGSPSDLTGSSSDNLDQFSEDNSAAENSENKKIGIMDSFELFYKEYKIMTSVAIFFATSLALLTLLVYLYINNPPTEVVQARQLFPWQDLFNNPQITKFLSSLVTPQGSSKGVGYGDRDGWVKPPKKPSRSRTETGSQGRKEMKMKRRRPEKLRSPSREKTSNTIATGMKTTSGSGNSRNLNKKNSNKKATTSTPISH